MRRFGISVSVLTLAVVGLVLLGSRPSAVAQESTPAAMAGHPIVGAWLLDVDANDPASPPALAIFHNDGTYLQAESDGGNGVGVWEATGARQVVLTELLHEQDETGDFAGTLMVRATIYLDEAGDAWTAEYTLEFTGPDGTSAGEMGPGTATAERITVEPMGTPVGPLMPAAMATPTA
jgi:hypothetical protein